MVLLTGGSGLLGTELRKIREYLAPSSKKMDVTNFEMCYNYILDADIAMIVHAAAYTDVDAAEKDKRCMDVNLEGTNNVAKLALYFEIPFIYISTDYVFDGKKGNYKESDQPSPLNAYGASKWFGEVATIYHKGHIIRTSFKPSKWEYDNAYANQITSADYVDVIANEIDRYIEVFNMDFPRIVHIATEPKTIYSLAIKRNPDVKMSYKEKPIDTSLNVDLWTRELK